MFSDAGFRSVRPYQLACLFCRAGADGGPLHPTQARVAPLADAIRQTPDLPLMLRCNLGDVCAYQNCGTTEDTPEGADFNRKRDADVLQWLDLAPGSVLPARLVLKRLLFRLPSVAGVCGYERVTGPAWQGCAKAFSGDYERGRERGIEAVIPSRPQAEMTAEKERSLQALALGTPVPVRPHLLLCAICQYGGGTRPPYAEDNLPELLQMACDPSCRLQVELVTGATWAVCGSCPPVHRRGLLRHRPSQRRRDVQRSQGPQRAAGHGLDLRHRDGCPRHAPPDPRAHPHHRPRLRPEPGPLAGTLGLARRLP